MSRPCEKTMIPSEILRCAGFVRLDLIATLRQGDKRRSERWHIHYMLPNCCHNAAVRSVAILMPAVCWASVSLIR
jgi:hypothetical protein